FDQSGGRIGAIRATREGMDNGVIPGSADLEDRTLAEGATVVRGAVEAAVARLDQCGNRIRPIVTVTEGMENSLHARGGDLEHDALAVGPEIACGPVEIAARGLNQRPLRIGPGPAVRGEGIEALRAPKRRQLEQCPEPRIPAVHRGSVEGSVR